MEKIALFSPASILVGSVVVISCVCKNETSEKKPQTVRVSLQTWAERECVQPSILSLAADYFYVIKDTILARARFVSCCLLLRG